MVGVSVHIGLRTRAATLAAAALMLKRASGGISAPFSLAFLTDRRRLPNPEPVMRALPAGAAVIYRDYDDPRREAMARRYRALCAARNILFLVAGDAALARLVGADGLHLPAVMLRAARSDFPPPLAGEVSRSDGGAPLRHAARDSSPVNGGAK